MKKEEPIFCQLLSSRYNCAYLLHSSRFWCRTNEAVADAAASLHAATVMQSMLELVLVKPLKSAAKTPNPQLFFDWNKKLTSLMFILNRQQISLWLSVES